MATDSLALWKGHLSIKLHQDFWLQYEYETSPYTTNVQIVGENTVNSKYQYEWYLSEMYIPKISTIHEPYSAILPPPYNTSPGVPTSCQSCTNKGREKIISERGGGEILVFWANFLAGLSLPEFIRMILP
jgi:hypothetical protein